MQIIPKVIKIICGKNVTLKESALKRGLKQHLSCCISEDHKK